MQSCARRFTTNYAEPPVYALTFTFTTSPSVLNGSFVRLSSQLFANFITLSIEPTTVASEGWPETKTPAFDKQTMTRHIAGCIVPGQHRNVSGRSTTSFDRAGEPYQQPYSAD